MPMSRTRYTSGCLSTTLVCLQIISWLPFFSYTHNRIPKVSHSHPWLLGPMAILLSICTSLPLLPHALDCTLRPRPSSHSSISLMLGRDFAVSRWYLYCIHMSIDLCPTYAFDCRCLLVLFCFSWYASTMCRSTQIVLHFVHGTNLTRHRMVRSQSSCWCVSTSAHPT